MRQANNGRCRASRHGLTALILTCAVACATTVGISSEQINAYMSDKPASLRPHYVRLLKEGKRNHVLNSVRLGVAAMERGEDALAARAFDEAIAGIEAVYADNPEAKKARRIFHNEDVKDFKGEPYERAMTYYYRGLLHLSSGEYDNARAAFRGGQLQDTLAEDQTYKQDFALLSFLEGWASKCRGEAGRAATAFKQAKQLKPNFRAPRRSDNLLIVAETGRGPQKVASGPGNSELHFLRGAGFRDEAVSIAIDSTRLRGVPIEDIYYQSTTRGGREIEKVVRGQAVFKDGAKAVGEVATDIGIATALAGLAVNNDDLAMAGAAVAVFGVLARVISAAVQTRADTRTWESLPDHVHVATARTRKGQIPVKVSFADGSGTVLPSMERRTSIVASRGRCELLWVRSGSADDSLGAARPLGVRVSRFSP